MKKSVEITKKSMLVSLFIAVFATVFSLLLANQSAPIANAQDDNFTRVFPQNNYFQSEDPTLLSANDAYLLIYDKSANMLFVRPNDSSGSYAYSLSFKEVTLLYVLEDVAFIQADGKYFTIDLTDKSASAQEHTLSAPEDISSISSDGTRLFVHSEFGGVAIYDKTLTASFSVESAKNRALIGQIVVAGYGDSFYTFPWEYGEPRFAIYDTTTNSTEYHSITQNIKAAYVADAIFALELSPTTNQKRIIVLNKRNGALLFQTEICPDDFFANGDKLFTIEGNSVIVYTLSSDMKSLSRTASMTMTGNDAFHLDHPSDLCVFDDDIVVADKNNDRLALIDQSGVMTDIVLEETPLAVTANSRDIYVAFANEVLRLSGGEIQKTYEATDVVDLIYLDKLYVLTKDGVYTLIADTLLKIYDTEQGMRLTAAKDGTNVYLLTTSGIVALNQSGVKLYDAVTDDFTDAVDFAIDYEGKIYVAFGDRIATYYDGAQTSVLYPKSASMKATLTSVCLSDSVLLFTAEESFVGAIDIGATTKNTYTSTFPQIVDKPYYFATAKEGALNYSADGRLENTSLASSRVHLVIDEQIEGDQSDEFRFALDGDKLVKIRKSDFDTASPTLLTGDYVAKQDTTLYALPHTRSSELTLKQGEKVTRVSDVAGYENNVWTLVTYDEKVYFVDAQDLEEYIEVKPEKDRVYGKANADRVGGLVNVYLSPDTQSELVTQIVDGSEVEVLDTVGDFYLVNFEGTIGYVEKAYIKINGLTTVQIVAIVLAIIVALAGTAIFASIYLTRKNAENKKNENKPQNRF